MAYNAKIGKISKSKLGKVALSMLNSMSEKQLKDFCKGPTEKPKIQG